MKLPDLAKNVSKTFLWLFIGILLLWGCRRADKKPNIVFIMTDDHSYQTLSAYDGRYIQTPNLDRIASEGFIFTNSFVTNSISAPSRADMLTRKFSHINGLTDNAVRFDSSQVTYPKLLQQAGYQTALIGKWHLKSNPTGFDFWRILPDQGIYYNPDFIWMDGKTRQEEGYVINIITDLSIDWLKKHDDSKPFCLLIHHKAVHREWSPDTTYLNSFNSENFPVPPNYFDTYEGRVAAQQQEMSIIKDMDLVYDLKLADAENEIHSPLEGWLRNGLLGRMNEAQRKAWDEHYQPVAQDFKSRKLSGDSLALWKYQHYLQDYLRCVRSVDDNVGRLLDYLDESGLSDNTIVIYCSDQGFYLGEHGWFDKRFMYEQSLRTPLLVRLPKSYHQKGEISEMVQNIDYAPTILDFAGIKIPAEMQGMSMKPLLTGYHPADWRNAIYYHYYEYPGVHAVKRHYGIRTEQYKLIHFYNDIDTWELFDLKNDPDEMHNLADSEKYSRLVEDLKKQLNDLQISYGDTTFLK
jgi:arylsulfatase A-like enzyme